MNTTTKKKELKSKARRYQPVIRVYANADEKKRIEENANRAGLSLSSFLLEVGQGYEVKNTIDRQSVLDLMKVSADLGRLGGLFKLWLTNDPKTANFNKRHIEEIIRQITMLKDEVRHGADSLLSNLK